MVLDDNIERAVMVEKNLLQNGFRVLALLTSASGLLNQIEQHKPDVIVIDIESPDRDVLESLAVVSQHNPTPTVMFSQKNDPDFVSQAVMSGVTAYQGRELSPDIVKPIIEVAMSQFRSFNLLRTAQGLVCPTRPPFCFPHAAHTATPRLAPFLSISPRRDLL